MGKKGFGALIKGLVWESDDTDNEELTEEELAELEESAEEAPASATKEETTGPSPVALNENIVDAIKEAIKEADLDGYDYYEFKKAVEEQKFPSDKEKYVTVFSVIKGIGVTVEHLLTTADHYVDVLVKHRADFDTTINEEEEAGVTALKAKADSIEDEINAKLDAIEKAKAEIEALGAEKDSVLAMAQKNEATISTLRAEGDLVYKMFADDISDSKSKINQYLK